MVGEVKKVITTAERLEHQFGAPVESHTSAPAGQPWCHRAGTTTTIQVDPHTWAFLRDPRASYPETQSDPPKQAWDKTTGSGYRPLAIPSKGSSQITDSNYSSVSSSTPHSICHRY